MSYLETAAEFYREVAQTPQVGLCCVQSTPTQLPGLKIPPIMAEMNYGCGTTVHPAELVNQPKVLYIGVGGGLEALQFAYYSRYPGAVIAIEPVEEMRTAAQRNLELAAEINPWFDPSFVEIYPGDAFSLPIPDVSVDIVAQNCLFNIFSPSDLTLALQQAYRVLKPGGRLQMSDPIATRPIPTHLQDDERLRAMCLSGALTYDEYIQRIINVGFGQIEIRARRPYRLLDKAGYNLEENLLLESLDSVAFKVPIAADGACVFTGKTAIYMGGDLNPNKNNPNKNNSNENNEIFDDGDGHILQKGVPVSVCDKTARKLAQVMPEHILITDSTWHYQGGGCC